MITDLDCGFWFSVSLCEF